MTPEVGRPVFFTLNLKKRIIRHFPSQEHVFDKASVGVKAHPFAAVSPCWWTLPSSVS